MPTYRPYTRVSDLPANSRGETTVLEAHLDAAHASIVDLVQFLIQALFSAGGVAIPGTVTNPSDALVRVQGRLGVSADARTVLAVTDQSVDLASVATGIKCLVVIRAEAGSTTAHTFTDAATGESITHSLLSTWGRLAYLAGDASNYPSVPDDCVPVAQVTKTGATTLTIDETLDWEPVTWQAGVVPRGTTADRPAAPDDYSARLYWDSTLGKLIAHNGTAWVNVDGSSL